MLTPKQYADELLEKYCIDQTTSEIDLPINPISIANNIGLTVAPYKRGTKRNRLSGEVVAEKKLILFNSSDSKERIRFTIAHELGHYVLQHGNSFRDPGKNFNAYNYDLNEVKANQFAAELLMPELVVKSLIDRKEITDSQRLANIFGVSLDALSIRLKSMGYA